MTLEVCCGDLQSVLAAKAGGAQRIELCSALSEGGLTPSAGLIAESLRVGIPKVHLLIRPRNGDFLYTPEEIRLMKADVAAAIRAGVDGIVIGALTAEGDVDTEACRRLIDATEDGVSVTFHRAFDLCRDPECSLEEIIALGCDRILTSGLAPTAEQGIPMLRKLNDLAAGRIIILAGGGVTAENARGIIAATGVTELHASAKRTIGSEMRFRRGDVSMGKPGADEYSRSVTDPSAVAAIINAMNS